MKHFSTEQGLASRFLVRLAERFAHSKQWKRRQTFALLCSELLVAQAIPLEQFATDVMPHLLDLSWDPVANVRLVVARTIANNMITNGNFFLVTLVFIIYCGLLFAEYFRDPNNQQADGLETVLRRLQTDKDQDVRQSAILKQYTNPLQLI